MVKDSIDPSGSVPPSPAIETLLLGASSMLTLLATGRWLAGVGVGAVGGVGVGAVGGVGVGAVGGVGVGAVGGVGVGAVGGVGVGAVGGVGVGAVGESESVRLGESGGWGSRSRGRGDAGDNSCAGIAAVIVAGIRVISG
jgi:hypothetical protein